MTINIIDPHLHLFDRSRGDYHWLKSENPPFWSDKFIIQQDFSIDDLTNSLALSGNINLSGFVHIEAGFDNAEPWRELDYINSLKPLLRRTIASVDLLSAPEHFKNTLVKLQQYQTLIGARHIFDEQAFTILNHQNTQKNLACLNEVTDFIFELQLPLADNSAIQVMSLLTQTITNNSQLRFIINHAGFPAKSTDNSAWHLWSKHINELAKSPNVFIKCSGWEMADREYEMLWLSKVISFCIEKFSINRVMLASNFPLCLFAQQSYGEYWQSIIQSPVIKQCSEIEKSALLYSNALNIYKI